MKTTKIERKNHPSRGGAAAMVALLALVALFIVPGPALADKLVLFKNGKALRVKTAVKDGTWLKCEFEDKSYISVPASYVQGIEESGLGAAGDSLRPNQVAAGSGGGYVPSPRGGDAGPPQEMTSSDPSVPADDPSVNEALEEERAYQRQREMEAQAAAAGGNRRGVPIAPGQGLGAAQQRMQPVMPGGLQPLNQASPIQNRRLNQRRGMLGERPPANNPGQANQDE